jgi:hypothetical protein
VLGHVRKTPPLLVDQEFGQQKRPSKGPSGKRQRTDADLGLPAL